MNKSNFAILLAFIILSCSLITYGQRDVYIFEPDYDIQYCSHKLLYEIFEGSQEYLVTFEGFYSKNALKNKYLHCRIDRKPSTRKFPKKLLLLKKPL